MATTKKRITIYIITGLVIILAVGAAITMGGGAGGESVAELLSLGERFLSELNYEQALVQFLRVIEIEPMNARAYYGAARAHIGLGQIDEAIETLRLGIEMTGDVQLQALLDEYELTGGASTAGNSGTTAGAVGAVPAPFTPEQRALVDQITDAMLAGDYELLFDLIQLPELHKLTAEFRGGFLYRDMFHFSRESVSVIDVRDSYSVLSWITYRPESGNNRWGIYWQLREHTGELPVHWLGIVYATRDMPLNGRFESVLFWGEREQRNARICLLASAMNVQRTIYFALNGYTYGEYYTRNETRRVGDDVHSGTISISNYENGFLVQTGSPRENGDIPIGVIKYFGPVWHFYGGEFMTRYTHPSILENQTPLIGTLFNHPRGAQSIEDIPRFY